VCSNPGRITKYYNIGIYCFSAKHLTLRSKDISLAGNQDNMDSEKSVGLE
jgi:hypothetical protein